VFVLRKGLNKNQLTKNVLSNEKESIYFDFPFLPVITPENQINFINGCN
jgi:hypothetical protein